VGQLGDLQLDVTSLSGQQTRPVTVALIGARVAAFVAAGADVLGGFELDQFLHHHAHGVTDQVDAVAGAQRVEKFGQGRLVESHRCVLLDGFLPEHTKNHADGSPGRG
jgi:hypothetical protein